MRRLALWLMIAAVAAMATGAAGAPVLLEVRSALTGVVETQPLVSVGEVVDDGQAMVYVRTALTDSVSVAARAPRAGVVREVVVVPGQRIERGDLVARIEPR
ncbi:MAG: biotin/lipoyl-containing protein [bacterium]